MHREYDYLSPEKSYKAKLRMYTFLLIFAITGLVSKIKSVHNILCYPIRLHSLSNVFKCYDITGFGNSFHLCTHIGEILCSSFFGCKLSYSTFSRGEIFTTIENVRIAINNNILYQFVRIFPLQRTHALYGIFLHCSVKLSIY